MLNNFVIKNQIKILIEIIIIWGGMIELLNYL